ncbi:hypothetical protein MIDIC_80013 [Alphaproteobacteria bacterium]
MNHHRLNSLLKQLVKVPPLNLGEGMGNRPNAKLIHQYTTVYVRHLVLVMKLSSNTGDVPTAISGEVFTLELLQDKILRILE